MKFSYISNIIGLGLISLILAGCFDTPVHDVAWFKAHKSESMAMLADCHSHQDKVKNNPKFKKNCVNAFSALMQLEMQKGS